MDGWTKKLGVVVGVVVGLSTLFLQRDALSTQLPKAAGPYLPAVLLGAITFAGAWLFGVIWIQARTALKLYAIRRRRTETRRKELIVADLRTLHAAHTRSPDQPPDHIEEARAVVIDGALSRMGLIPAALRTQDREAMVRYLAWLIAFVEERGVDNAMRFLWPLEMQPRSWRRRTLRGGRRSLWHRVLDRLADQEEEERAAAQRAP